jgi:hypothetical protein
LRRQASPQPSTEVSDIGIFRNEFDKSDNEAEDSEDKEGEAMRRELP